MTYSAKDILPHELATTLLFEFATLIIAIGVQMTSIGPIFKENMAYLKNFG